MKSYTSLEQSRKLAEILPFESADMHYVMVDTENEIYSAGLSNYIGILPSLPCWSFAALLSVIPKRIKDYNVLRIDISENDFAIWYDEIGYGVNNDLPNITMESAVDACYKIIIELKELNLL